MNETKLLKDVLPEHEPRRYFRNPAVVLVRELNEDTYLVSDLNDKNEYIVSRAVLKREFEEL